MTIRMIIDVTNPVTTLVFNKYADFKNGATESTYRYMIPMIRMSEIYMIAAEATTDRNEAYELLNAIRSHRNSPDLDSNDNFDISLVYEFAREMVGEGQLYFFYKRRQESLIISRTGSYDFNMLQSNYVWPIPESEIDKRIHTEK